MQSTFVCSGAAIRQFTVHFGTLLEAVARNTRERISAFPMLTETERRQLLVEWNNTHIECPRCCVHELFEAQARRSPQSVAVGDDTQQLQYRDLNARSNRLANFLKQHGVGPEVLVGISVDRSVDMAVGILGILKAGGAYLPLDPEYPAERLAFMQRDAGIRVVVSQEKFRERLSSVQSEFVWLDSQSGVISQQSSDDFVGGGRPDNLAYVTYTSGSTGVPKGVQITHRSVVNLLTSMQPKLAITAEDTILAITPLQFDVATAEIFLPLVAGSCLVVASQEAAAGGKRLGEALESSDATVLVATPSILRLLLESGWQGSRHIRVHATGEALPRELARELVKKCSSLWNLYGPTETTVWSTAFRVSSADAPICIGVPIGNTQCYVFDSHLQPLPIGVTGELYIGGDGLARGYLNRPELTDENFIRNPFRDEAGSRLYKTGDQARYLSDGNIVCLGRLDNQVKIRGVRVELGDIEAILGQHPAVGACVAAVYDDTTGDKQLVAYVVPKRGQTLATHELRKFLAHSLPAHMLPTRFEYLQTFPLTVTGKVDRKALPPPGTSRSEADKALVPPRTAMEEKLVEIWREVLDLEDVGVNDNFFDLGGQSFLAVRLIAQVERSFSITLSLAALLRGPTIQDMAAYLSERRGAIDASRRTPIQPLGSRPPFFCVGAGPLFRSLAQHLGLDQPFLSLSLSREEINSLPVPFKLETMAAVLASRLREVQPEGPYFLGGWCADGVLAYETARQVMYQGGKVALLVLFDTENPNPLAETTKARPSKWLRLLNRIGFHFKNLRRIRAAERMGYLLDIMKTRLMVSKLHAWGIFYKLLMYTLGDIPSGFRDFNSMEFFAVCGYRPECYPGRVVLIPAHLGVGAHYSDPRLGWGEVVSGELEVYSVACGHSDLFRDPHVRTLARKLDACLSVAQASVTQPTRRPEVS
jgi:amino acid adenylation domain-containing protein